MKQKKHSSRVWGVVALITLCVGAAAAMVGLTNTVHDIAETAISKTPDAILASAGVSEAELVRLPVMYYDQRADECINMYDAGNKDALEVRQFEWSSCGYYNKQIEQGLVEYELNDEYLPVAVKGKLTPNRGIDMTRWYSVVDGKSASYTGTLGMQYVSNGAEFVFDAKDFYPLDDVSFSDGDEVNKDGHNHLFTMNFAVPFTVLASGAEEFSIRADDDTFVYVGDKLAIDMGGIHEATSGRFMINKNGEVYTGIGDEDLAYSGINVSKDGEELVRIFHADRDSQESVFSAKFAGMNLSVMDSELADSDEGIQIAYDPSDPTYVAPLGESKVVRPDTTKGLVVLATIEGVAIVAIALIMASVIRYVVCRKTQE